MYAFAVSFDFPKSISPDLFMRLLYKPVVALKLNLRHRNYLTLQQQSSVGKPASLEIMKGQCPSFNKYTYIYMYVYVQTVVYGRVVSCPVPQNPRWIYEAANSQTTCSKFTCDPAALRRMLVLKSPSFNSTPDICESWASGRWRWATLFSMLPLALARKASDRFELS